MNRLYYNGDQPGASIELSEDLLFDVLSDIYRSKGGKPGSFSRELFNEVRSRMSRAVDRGVEDTPEAPDAFKGALRHSGDVFAAFKVHRAQRDMAAQLLDSKGNLKSFEQWSNDVLPIASHQFGPWLRTEYNTAVLRARQAADWQRFEEHKDILPNLKWVPSTSANPGADHMVYWGTILPEDHQFWSSHHPGDRWNCKCALEATDEPASGVPLDDNPEAAPHPGLDDNPGKSRRLFSDSHPYFPADCSSCPFNSGIKNRIRTLFTARKKDCCNCRIINSHIPDPEKERRKVAKAKYKELLNNPEYKDVQFDKESGGVIATHIGHNTEIGRKELFNNTMSGADLEKECTKQLFHAGHSVILCNESKLNREGQKYSALDMELDGVMMDIKSITSQGWYSHALKSKTRQLKKYNDRPDIHSPANSICLYFHDPTLFDEKKMQESINYYINERIQKNKPQLIRNIYVVLKEVPDIKLYKI